MEEKFIEDFEDEEHIKGYFGLVEKSVRTTRKDKLYLDLTLCDKTGVINTKMWDGVEEVKDKIQEGDAVAVHGFVNTYNQKLQLTVKNIRTVNEEDEEYGFTFEDLVRTTEIDIEKVWNDLQKIIDSIENKYLKKLVTKIYNKEENKLKIHPASMTLHHAYQGGLLEHIYNTTENAIGICDTYPELNKDLVLAGILLHDIGKTEELTSGINISYTDKGNFTGHIILSRDIIKDNINKIDDFPEILAQKLEHIILSHHGKQEWGSPKEPSFLEASIVYYADRIDTRFKQIDNIINSDESDGDWTDIRNYFGRPFYKK